MDVPNPPDFVKQALSVLDSPLDALPDAEDLAKVLPSAEEVVEAAMAWHFNEATGSKFWLDRASSLPFDPRRDIRTVADLTRFPDILDELRTVPVEDLVPRGLKEYLGDGMITPWVWESGGTTGAPKRLIEAMDRPPVRVWSYWMMDQNGFDDFAGENWLHLGPTGPHLFGYGMAEAARERGGMVFNIDFDPRWVKRCLAEGRAEEVGRYVQHLLDQTEWILKSQSVAVLATTPPILEAMAGRAELTELVREKVRGIVWAGASMSRETRKLLETEIIPDLKLMGIYGNTMMGGALQRPAQPGDAEDCVFQPFHPYLHLDLVDEHGEQVDVGERGRVRVHRMDPVVFLPNAMERDTAIRVAQAPGYLSDGVADVQPLAKAGGKDVIEGVY
jgi:hypothetical protein